jgi:hypothetical protein
MDAGCMIAPCASTIRFYVYEDLGAEEYHGCSIEGEQTFERFVC